MKDPVVSVVIPVYNAEKYIEETINSVLQQTFKDFEIIAVDDCSTDNSLQILNALAEKDARIRVFKNEKNSRVAETRNFGVQHAKGEFIALLDADDKWKVDKLQKQLDFLKEKNGQLCFTSVEFIDDDGKLTGRTFLVPEKVNRKNLFKQNVITTSSVLIKTSLLKKYPMHNDELHEDFICWLEVLQEVDFAFGMREILTIYRLAKNSKSRNKFKSMKMTYKTYRLVGENFIKSHIHLASYIIRSLKKYGKEAF